MRPQPSSRRERAGLAPVDVVVALAVALVVVLFVLMALPRSRETARLASCRRNMAQIGQAIFAYHSAAGELPLVGPLSPVGRPIEEAPPSPHKAMLDELGVADFLGIDVVQKDSRPSRSAVPGGGVVAGFICPSDAGGLARFRAPTSYRACVGSDFAGTDGPFAPGRRMTLHEVERRDGTAYTAAFSERLLGDGRDAAAPVNYAEAGGIVDQGSTMGEVRWRGDAGSDWVPADFRYTLYTHAAAPNSPESRVALDGRSSSMGASSAHVGGVIVLMLDGSARLVAPSLNLDVWRAMGSVGTDPDEPTPIRN